MFPHPDRKNPRADSCKKARYECCLAASGKAACDLYHETCPELRRTIESSAGIIDIKATHELEGKLSAAQSRISTLEAQLAAERDKISIIEERERHNYEYAKGEWVKARISTLEAQLAGATQSAIQCTVEYSNERTMRELARDNLLASHKHVEELLTAAEARASQMFERTKAKLLEIRAYASGYDNHQGVWTKELCNKAIDALQPESLLPNYREKIERETAQWCAEKCGRLADMMEKGAGEIELGGRLRQAERDIQSEFALL